MQTNFPKLIFIMLLKGRVELIEKVNKNMKIIYTFLYYIHYSEENCTIEVHLTISVNHTLPLYMKTNQLLSKYLTIEQRFPTSAPKDTVRSFQDTTAHTRMKKIIYYLLQLKRQKIVLRIKLLSTLYISSATVLTQNFG